MSLSLVTELGGGIGTYLKHVKHGYCCNAVISASGHERETGDKHAGSHAKAAEDEKLTPAYFVEDEPMRMSLMSRQGFERRKHPKHLPWDDRSHEEPKLEATRQQQRLLRVQTNTVDHDVRCIVCDDVCPRELLQGLRGARNCNSLPAHDATIREAIFPANGISFLECNGVLDLREFEIDPVVLRLSVPQHAEYVQRFVLSVVACEPTWALWEDISMPFFM